MIIDLRVCLEAQNEIRKEAETKGIEAEPGSAPPAPPPPKWEQGAGVRLLLHPWLSSTTGTARSVVHVRLLLWGRWRELPPLHLRTHSLQGLPHSRYL